MRANSKNLKNAGILRVGLVTIRADGLRVPAAF
jgi:hypothetical protein